MIARPGGMDSSSQPSWQPTPQPWQPQVQYGGPAPPLKNPGLAAVLALVVGALLFWGVGHIYVGKVLKGIGIMVAGWVVEGLLLGSFFFGLFLGVGLIMALFFGLLSLGGWIWQTFDAYSLAKQYNDQVRLNGREPW